MWNVLKGIMMEHVLMIFPALQDHVPILVSSQANSFIMTFPIVFVICLYMMPPILVLYGWRHRLMSTFISFSYRTLDFMYSIICFCTSLYFNALCTHIHCCRPTCAWVVPSGVLFSFSFCLHFNFFKLLHSSVVT